MNVLDQKKLLIERIVPHLASAPPDVVQRLLQKSVSDLAQILENAITKKTQAGATEEAHQYAAEMRRESQRESAWVGVLRTAWLNGKRLADIHSNKEIMENLLHPHEEPSSAIYTTLATQYADKFSWQTPPQVRSEAERVAEFSRICRQNNLSECEANRKLHSDGVGIEHWAGASQVESAAYAKEAATARQKWLVKTASPTELRAEARYENQQRAAANQQDQFNSTMNAYAQRDQTAYRPIPLEIDRKHLISASHEALKRYIRLYGQKQLNEVLRVTT